MLGPGIRTQVQDFVTGWANSAASGVLVLTGNAGTGKTALAEAWCGVLGEHLPQQDGLIEVVNERWVVKDLSGVRPADRSSVVALVERLHAGTAKGQLLLCANEGLLRSVLTVPAHKDILGLLDQALIKGAARATADKVVILNMNRQRWTASRVWTRLLEYVSRPELWDGCEACSASGKCPILANARALQQEGPQTSLRGIVQLASGSTVATLRELLGILALSITGGLSCDDVVQASEPFDARFAYFNLVFGASLTPARIERSTLLQGMRESGIGAVADLTVDGWLRDAGDAPPSVRRLAAPPDEDSHAEVQTRIGKLTFAAFGETITVSDDAEAVRLCLEDFTRGRDVLALWRRRVFFEVQTALGGERSAFARLTSLPFFGDLLALARGLRHGREPGQERTRLITGLNYLAAGFHAYPGALVVPDPASLAARNPGAFRLPAPSVVHSDIPVSEISLHLEDSDDLRTMIETDDVRVVLSVRTTTRRDASLLLTPRLYQAIRESNDFRAPVGSDIPEMAELATFYAALADGPTRPGLRIVDPATKVIKEVVLPDLAVS